ncbi:hypothetical protein EUGRSUZ_C03631 [Eucalyptus grandis]|uniref:Uncharacterized protein n=2 Tax=Eucalyptus grandis TaxID=71139 RepID=A0ACC3LIC4_EUCGR|nr:hypothetical protein EUGRSUZ_C03631 [Eucalyptus grandis]
MILCQTKVRCFFLAIALFDYEIFCLESNGSSLHVLLGHTKGYVLENDYGSAFLMQKELQWLESDPSSKCLKWALKKERRGKTYWEVFVKLYKDLFKEARETCCSVVATLIATIVFATAFTLPGGNNGTGIPIFLRKGSFMLFAAATALALFSSITAILMFLAIVTSRYTTKDYLQSLPKKMMLGLTFLFLSLAFMLVAFGFALTIVLSK